MGEKSRDGEVRLGEEGKRVKLITPSTPIFITRSLGVSVVVRWDLNISNVNTLECYFLCLFSKRICFVGILHENLGS